ncbi:MAG: 4-hydroxy-tetrahydrodipicolinate reductase [Bacteroidota bacterium]|nr:4-hydroxy-tetrahydrodipicolinate reductase [Bacteroidota bacterium]
MNILILGYGKMGKTIEKIAIERGHSIVKAIDREDRLTYADIGNAQVAIEFTQPDAAFENVKFCLQNNVPIISGTTGWLDKKPEAEALCKKNNGTFFYASNFSVGVNLFFKLNKYLAGLMRKHPSYTVSLEEIHHTEKKDSPSGTAITLAEGVLEYYETKKSWANEPSNNTENLEIISFREAGIPGTHTVKYSSDLDEILIKHTAHKRESFALGAVLVAEWIIDKKGVLNMDDFLKL